tara:strand:+ start:1432 stop:2289 length:858 start_codon:yes stop_codon:yes gene_type:complete
MKFSGIANNTFSYLLTLDEFRSKMPDEYKPSWIKITTITVISKFEREIDIKKLREVFEENGSIKLRRVGSDFDGFEWKIKPTTFYNQITLTYEDQYSVKSVKIFPNGSIQIAGASDLLDAKRIITQLEYLFKICIGLEKPTPLDSFRVVMINSNFSLNYNVNLMEVAQHFETHSDIFKISFEPDRYSAVKIKFRPAEEMKEITTSIFSTGKVIITGAETLKEIVFAYNIINQHINQNEKIRVKRTQDTDTFNIFLGHNIETMIRRVRANGYHSWLKTITNRKINF